MYYIFFYIKFIFNNIVEDEASENNLPKKILLKQKNVKKRAIENINNSDKECAPKKKRFSKSNNITIIHVYKIIKEMHTFFLILKLLILICDNIFIDLIIIYV